MRDHYLSLDARFYPSPIHHFSQMFFKATDQGGIFLTSAKLIQRPGATGKTALVVDDVADVTEMLSVLLTQAGYTVVTASSAPQALGAAEDQQFDVIISDIGMPGMNGYQLAREIRLLPGYASVPMVAVTGYSMFDDRERSMSAGFNAHLTKPIDPRELLDLIEQL
ncbi:MAG: hypothetical protein C5B55_12195 [Blastocatellia bacterium]|nr:MAG: hypothetical protein C5B55_12195 [Blastocatellia bacterium]